MNFVWRCTPRISSRPGASPRRSTWSWARDRAQVSDAGTVVVSVPTEYRATLPDLLARLEPIPIAVDTMARVVINERTGTVVLGGDVRIGPVAVAHGNLSLRIATQYNVSQPDGVLGRANRGDAAKRKSVLTRKRASSWPSRKARRSSDVVRALNTLGVTPRDIIAIMQALKASGALRAEVVIL